MPNRATKNDMLHLSCQTLPNKRCGRDTGVEQGSSAPCGSCGRQVFGLQIQLTKLIGIVPFATIVALNGMAQIIISMSLWAQSLQCCHWC